MNKPTRVFPILDLADPEQQQAYVDRFNAAVAACKQVLTYVPGPGAAPVPRCFMYIPVSPVDAVFDSAALFGVQGVFLEDLANYMATCHRELATDLCTALALELYAADGSIPASTPQQHQPVTA